MTRPAPKRPKFVIADRSRNAQPHNQQSLRGTLYQETGSRADARLPVFASKLLQRLARTTNHVSNIFVRIPENLTSRFSAKRVKRCPSESGNGLKHDRFKTFLRRVADQSTRTELPQP
jgi:hypothetical protein